MIDGVSDLLVIGAGPAGSAAAIVAARAGARVCVVDRASFPRPKTCGDAISNSAFRIVEHLVGSAADSVPRAVVRGAVAVFPDGSRVRRSYGDSPGAIVERTDFDDLLRRGAEETGARIVEGTTVRHLVQSSGRFIGADGPGFRWRADVVVVADGTASLAWDALGMEAPAPRALGISATAYYAGLADGPDPGYSEHFFEKSLPTGYAWIFPHVNGRANVGVYLRVDRYRTGQRRIVELLDDFVVRYDRRFGGAKRVGGVRTWSLPLATFAPPLAGPGLLVCGDAARLIDPLTGEGIWHALHSGSLAGRFGTEALGKSDTDAATRSLSQRYQRAVRREIAWPTAVRRGLEAATTLIVERSLYRSPLVRRCLEWGYNRKSLEISKALD